MHLRLTTFALAAIALLLLAAVAVAPATRVDLARSSVPIQVASTSAPDDVPLSDILIGRYQPGFFPILDGVVQGSPRADRVVWLRLQTQLPAGERAWFVRLERAPVDRVAVLLPDQPLREVAESRFFRLGSWDARWPDGFVLPLPAGLSGDVAIYVRVEGNVDADLRPQLIDGAVLAEREAAAIRLFALVYGVLLVSLALCFFGPIRRAGAGGTGMAMVIGITVLTVALVNDHLPLPLRAVLDPWLGGGLVYSATVLLAGALLIVARRQSGLKANSSALALWYWRGGLVLMLVALLGVYVPADFADLLRRVAELIWSQAWLLVLVAFALDRRRLRSVPITLMVLLIVALITRALAAAGAVPPSALALYGYQLLMAVLMLSLVLLPWMRGLPVDAPKAPAPVPEVPLAERWAQAQAAMTATIASALRHGGAGEADWVVGRRLVETLKPLLEARSVAVARSTLHGEDTVLSEPASAAPAYASLLRDRARVLRSLLRLGSPQQLVLPMGEGGSSQVALVPYLLSDTGWTAVFIEREGRGFDADELMRADAMVEAARRVAGAAIDARDAALRADLDPTLDILNADALQRDLRTAFERCRDGGEPIALLRVPLAGEGGFEVRARAVIDALEALDTLPSHLLGRPGPDELWLVLPGLDVPGSRGFAEALHRRLAPAEAPVSGLAPAGARPRMAEWIIGISAIVPGERVPRPMIERAGEALNRARVPGAQGVQAVVPSI
jgi:GGDEF domain-containing protein